MSKVKYQARVCDGEACKEVGRATSSMALANRRMAAAVEKLRRRRLKGKAPHGSVGGSVYPVERGEQSGPPVFVSGSYAGDPESLFPKKVRSRRRPPLDE